MGVDQAQKRALATRAIGGGSPSSDLELPDEQQLLGNEAVAAQLSTTDLLVDDALDIGRRVLPWLAPGLGPAMELGRLAGEIAAAPRTAVELAEERRRALTPADAQDRARTDPTYTARLALAQELIKVGGTGDLTDGRVVIEELVDMPLEALQILQQKGTRVVACRGSVTDYLADLRGVQPRGWPPGATWDSVPGLNNIATNEVVIATRGHGTEEGPHVPRSGDGHGAYSLTVHECMHGVDLNHLQPGETARSEAADFLAARNADAASLGASGYLSQAGAAGHQETYAEVAARYYAGDPTLRRELPNLYAYFAANPLAAERTAKAPEAATP